MICPRCENEKAAFFMKSPVGDSWELYKCRNCGFMWRTSEEEDLRDPKTYNPAFKILSPIEEYRKTLVRVPPLEPKSE